MISSLYLWLRAIKIRILERLAYKSDFLISLFTMFLIELSQPLLLFIIYYNSQGFLSWTFNEVLLIQGIFLLVKGFSFMAFFGIVWQSNILLQNGTFDLLLLKPRNPLFMFVTFSFDSEDIAKLLGGILLTALALFLIGDFSYLNLLLALILVIIGIIYYFALALLFSTYIFRFTKTYRLYEILDIFNMFGNYPKSIYPKTIGYILSTLFPIFIVAAFPTQALLGKFSYEILISAISAILICIFSTYLWFQTLKKYSSAGG